MRRSIPRRHTPSIITESGRRPSQLRSSRRHRGSEDQPRGDQSGKHRVDGCLKKFTRRPRDAKGASHASTAPGRWFSAEPLIAVRRNNSGVVPEIAPHCGSSAAQRDFQLRASSGYAQGLGGCGAAGNCSWLFRFHRGYWPDGLAEMVHESTAQAGLFLRTG